MTGFNGDTQFDLLRRYLGEISVTRSLSLLLGCAVLTLAAVSLLLWRRSGRAPRPLFETELWRYTRALPGMVGEEQRRLVMEVWEHQTECQSRVMRFVGF